MNRKKNKVSKLIRAGNANMLTIGVPIYKISQNSQPTPNDGHT